MPRRMMNDSDASKRRQPTIPSTSQRRRSYLARKKLQAVLKNLEKDLAHAAQDARILQSILQQQPDLLNLIGPEDINRWRYPLTDFQRDLDDLIDTFASLGRS